jgi:hypothetical protein
VTVGVPEEFSLLGSTTIDLYGVATAEISALAEAEGGVVRRLYWVQFEGYHEGSGGTYDYSEEPWRVEIDGRSFYAGPNAYPKEDLTEAREGSDSRAMVQLVRDAGLVLPDELARVRLVHLDGAHRNELMIIYLEDLVLSGTSLAALDTDIPERDRLVEAIRDRTVATAARSTSRLLVDQLAPPREISRLTRDTGCQACRHE